MRNKIGWCDATVNCIGGCTRVSAGCDNCWACQMAVRLQTMGKPLYRGVVKDGNWTGRINFDIEPLRRTLHWRKPRRIFVNSMSDTFHEGVTDDQRDQMFALMALAPQHTFLVLTKRAKEMRNYLFAHTGAVPIQGIFNRIARYSGHRYLLCSLPIPNIHLLVTVENQAAADEQIPLLPQTPAAVRGICVEPMLEEINLRKYIGGDDGSGHCSRCGEAVMEMEYHECPPGFGARLDWVVIGCETGAHRRKTASDEYCHLSQLWVESLVNQCQAAGVPVWVKALEIGGRVVHDIAQFPPHLQLRELPK